MVLRECPFCHRPFEAELLSNERVDSSEVAKVGDFPLQMSKLTGQLTEGGLAMSRGSLILGISQDEKEAVAMRPEAFIRTRLCISANTAEKSGPSSQLKRYHFHANMSKTRRKR